MLDFCLHLPPKHQPHVVLYSKNPIYQWFVWRLAAEVDFNLDVPFRIISEWSNESEYRRPILQPVVEPSGKVSVGWFKGKSEP